MRVLVVLVPGFSHLSLGAIVEPLHRLGLLAPDLGLRVEIGAIGAGEGGGAVEAAAGPVVHCGHDLPACLAMLRGAARPDAVFLCCGLRTPYRAQGEIRALLRAADRAGVAIWGTGCAAWKMADAGMLRQGSGTVHWTTLPAFAERHGDIAARDALFVTSGHATSSPGEAAALDMVLAFIAELAGDALAREIAAHLMIGQPRPGHSRQPRSGGTDELRDAPPALRRAVDIMGEHLETPLRVADVARAVGLSVRQVERLFARHLGRAPKAHYLALRLDHARMLIEQTALPILEISLAAGFSSRRAFTRMYRDAFGFAPTQTRRSP